MTTAANDVRRSRGFLAITQCEDRTNPRLSLLE
jgi:hypothetical protein